MFARVFGSSQEEEEESTRDDEYEIEAETEQAVAFRDRQWAFSGQHSMGPSYSYGSTDDEETDLLLDPHQSHVAGSLIRFQVIIWYVGPVDAVLGLVDMHFRVTVFWNAPGEGDEELGYGLHNPNYHKVWAMYGRQRAFEKEITEITEGNTIVYVPPVSILNAVDFESKGDPEVCQLDKKTRLMKWSCLYKASLQQEDLNVANFPHDEHNLILRLGILKHRQRGKRWDRTKWKLALATAEDTKDTISVPHGLVIDHVIVPGFSYTPEDALDFDFVSLDFGGTQETHDACLQVKLRVQRHSSYYDRNIIPLLAALNLVAVSTLTLQPKHFGARGEIITAIAFVEIGIRMTIDSRLPIVGYIIKIQSVLNHFFFGLLFLVLESSLAYFLYVQCGLSDFYTGKLDLCACSLELVHLAIVLKLYYTSQ